MGKGDGKKKRKKKSSAVDDSSSQSSSSPSSQSSQSSAPRVTTAINIPIKRQIAWAKLNQSLSKSSSSFRQPALKRTAYRKQLDETSHAAMLHFKKTRSQHVDWDVILQHGNGSLGPLMLVDGYNVIYQWSRLKKHMLKNQPAMARDLLVRDLEELHQAKQWRIECVFDGFGRNAKGPLGDGPNNGHERVSAMERVTQITDTGRGVRICYSGVGASADSYIEKRCLDAKDVTQGKLTGSLIVVSNDAMIKLVAAGAGALCMSSDRFVDELKAVKKVTKYRVEAALAMVNNNINSDEIGNTQQQTPSIRMQGAQGQDMKNAVGLNKVDGVQVINTFRGGQFVIEDKRLRKKKKTINVDEDFDFDENYNFTNQTVGATFEDKTTSIPSWAMLPESTNS
jgi:predicted RNA-binding protein with PIN domain